jgi:hypothetical protein
MKRFTGYVAAALLGVFIGYFAGREHLKYEMRSALNVAAEEIQKGLSSAFGIGDEAGQQREQSASGRNQQREQVDIRKEQEDAIKSAYISERLELYDISAKYTDSLLDGKVPGVLFKIRNNGERSLDRVEVTVYFKGQDGRVVAEEDYAPVRVSEYSFSGDNKPLKPGYIWQMERGKFYAAKQVPSEWNEGSIDASITSIRFSE